MAAPNTFIYIAFFFNIGRRTYFVTKLAGFLFTDIRLPLVYSNSMLATLNARSIIRGQLSETQTVSMSKMRKNNSSVNPSQVSTLLTRIPSVSLMIYKRPPAPNTLDLKVSDQYQLNSVGPSSVFDGSSGFEAEVCFCARLNEDQIVDCLYCRTSH